VRPGTSEPLTAEHDHFGVCAEITMLPGCGHPPLPVGGRLR
jgi:hypothetical protein